MQPKAFALVFLLATERKAMKRRAVISAPSQILTNQRSNLGFGSQTSTVGCIRGQKTM